MPTGLPKPDAKNFGDKIREFALVGLGLTNNKLDAFVTLRMLQDAGVANISQRYLSGSGGTTGSGSGPAPTVVEPAIDLTPPPPPGGFIATAGVTQILFQTTAPVYRQGHGHARTKIYAAGWDGVSALPTFADAVLYTDFPGNIGVSPFDPASNLRLWATWTSVDGRESEPAGGTNGVGAATGLLEDQHIANLAVGKLLAGSLDVGQYIQSADYVAGVSGWRIATLAGGAAFFECRGNAVFGGTIYAAAGTIGGSTIGANYIRSTNYVLTGQGWNFNSDGTGQIGGFTVTSTDIRSTNYVAGATGWRLSYDGTGQIGGVTIGSNYLRSNNYVVNVSGWNLNNDGTGQIGGFVVGSTYIQSTNYVPNTSGWKIANDGTMSVSRLALYGFVQGSFAVPNNTVQTYTHSEGRLIVLSVWSTDGNVSLTDLNTNSFSARLDNSGGGTVHFAYV